MCIFIYVCRSISLINPSSPACSLVTVLCWSSRNSKTVSLEARRGSWIQQNSSYSLLWNCTMWVLETELSYLSSPRTYIFTFNFICEHVCMCICLCVYVYVCISHEELTCAIISFCLEVSRDRVRVVKLSSKYFYLLS